MYACLGCCVGARRACASANVQLLQFTKDLLDMQIQILPHEEYEAQGASTKFRRHSFQNIKDTIVIALRDILGSEVHDDKPLMTEGLDSLAAMELRKRMQVQYFNCKAQDLYALSEKCYMAVIMKACISNRSVCMTCTWAACRTYGRWRSQS